MAVTPCQGPRKMGSSWSEPSSPLAFPAGRVDVWRMRLDEPPEVVSDATSDVPSNQNSQAGVLSTDEVARANRFHFEKDRAHFTRCRSALRRLLAEYLAIPAAEIRFEYLAGGKPQIAADQNPRALQFNVSHSSEMALIAVGSGFRLGVDIEKIRDSVDVMSLSERFFSLRERDSLRSLPDRFRVPGFFACWTRKEAFLKATGDGLSFPLADFSVTTNPDLDPEIEEIRGNAEARKQWFMADLRAGDGYRATVAVEGAVSRLDTYTYLDNR